ncbi:MAG TPA: hypothetical protein VL294_05930 [Pseudolysinimonas sp.]|jgi:hypothetical protein|nr:hypothetical protein [Pseudolysinimonas sp.]
MKNSFRAIIATTLTSAALVAATALPASALTVSASTIDGEPVTLTAIQKAGAEATGKRIDALTTALTRVERNESLTEADRTTITATLQADLDAMHTLASQIAADTTRVDALTHYHQIFTDYRVYAVALPQALYAAGADRLTGTALPRLQKAYDALVAKIGDSPTDEQQRLLDAMAADIADATSGADGLAAASLAVTPADWNADHDVMRDIRTRLHDAIRSARDAASAGRDLAETLR